MYRNHNFSHLGKQKNYLQGSGTLKIATRLFLHSNLQCNGHILPHTTGKILSAMTISPYAFHHTQLCRLWGPVGIGAMHKVGLRTPRWGRGLLKAVQKRTWGRGQIKTYIGTLFRERVNGFVRTLCTVCKW